MTFKFVSTVENLSKFLNQILHEIEHQLWMQLLTNGKSDACYHASCRDWIEGLLKIISFAQTVMDGQVISRH